MSYVLALHNYFLNKKYVASYSLLLLISSFIFSPNILAHEVRPSYLELIQKSENTYNVLWKVPAKGNLHLALYLQFADDVKNMSEPVEYFSDGAYIKRWDIYHPSALINTKIKIQGLQFTFTEALVRIEHLDGSVQISRLMPEQPTVLIEASPTSLQVAKTYTGLGIKHILIGIDHLLFLVCLILIAGTPKRILITVTGFTLAHSLTLALSSLNFVTLRVGPVEAVIALSIVFLATEIVKGKRDSLTWKYPISVSSSFGLLHGFGFSAVLKEIGLPETELVTGLLFFNVGVEIGQLIFIGMVLFVFSLAQKTTLSWPQHSMKITGYAVGSVSVFWLIQRLNVF